VTDNDRVSALSATMEMTPALEQRAARPGIAGRLWAAVRRVLTRTGRPERPLKLLERGGGVQTSAPPTINWEAVAGRQRDAVWASLRRQNPLSPEPPTGTQARELPWGEFQDHPGFGVTVERIVSIFRQAEVGYPQAQCDLFDDLIEGDCHLRNLFEQRSQAVAGKPYVIQAGGGAALDEQAARVLRAALNKLPLIEFFEHQLSCNRYGWAATEIDWGVVEAEGRRWVVPVALTNVPARRFRIHPDSGELLLLTATSPQGEPLIPGKWVVTCRPGPLARAALMRTAAFPATYKRFANRDWVIYSHKFGLPLTLAKYGDENTPAGDATGDPTRVVGQEIIPTLGNDGGAVVPRSVGVEVVEAGRNADASGTHGALIGQQNREMSKLVNGSTLANDNADSGGASYALGAVHDSVRWDNVQYDAERLRESTRLQVSVPFLVYNSLAGRAEAPLLSLQIAQDVTPKTRVEVADAYVNKLGGKLSRAQLGQDLGFREPLNEADTLAGAPKPEPAAAPPQKVAA